MKNIVLILVKWLRPVWRWLGADAGQLQAIVATKLTLDNRRTYATFGRHNKTPEHEQQNTFLKVLGTYAFMGIFTSIGFLALPAKESIFLPLTVQFGYVMVVCAMTLLADFSSLILDSADNQIILPRPVSSRTLLLARIVHIAGYLFSIALAMSIVGVVVVSVRFGPVAGVLFLLMALLAAVLMVFLTNVFYLLLMQFMSGERLREVVNYFQIVMAIMFFGAYQLLPQLMRSTESMSQEATEFNWWYYLIPPMWMAGAVDAVVQPVFDGPHLLLLGLAVVMPFAGLWVMNRVLAPIFNQRLAGLEQDSRPVTKQVAPQLGQPTLNQPITLVDRLTGWLTNSPLERAAFGLVWRVTARDRKFKLKTYPQLGFGLAYVVFMSIGSRSTFSQSSGFYLFALYYTGLFIMTAQYQLAVSDNYKAGWLYGSTPIQQPGHLLSGGLKALIVKLMVPYYALVASYLLYRYGADKIDDVLLAFFNSLAIALLTAASGKRYLPFSMPQDAINRNNTSRSLLMLLILGATGGVHYGLTYLPYAVWVATPVAAGVFVYLLREYSQTTWAKIAS